MKRTIRAGAVALAFAGLIAQPMAANATIAIPYCPPHVAAGSDAGPFPMLFVVGYFLCAGVALGRQDVDAHGQPVSGQQRADALLGCLLPIHFHKHHHP